MDVILRDEEVRARKTYRCDAYSLWKDVMEPTTQVSEKDYLILHEADYDKGRILPGQLYRRVVGINDGRFSVYRARIDMDRLCDAYDLYDYLE